jgi:pimeloyl-ACP methyl ester carboxylesterase
VLRKSAHSLLNETSFWESLKIFSHPNYTDQTTELLSRLIKHHPESEVSWMQNIHDALPLNSTVFLGNSLVMRNFELVQTKVFKIYGNRGVNGIDGQIATTIGLANSSPDMVYAILGDLTTFYDLSSLMNLPSNLKIIVINNDGGRIFDVLKLNPKMILEHGKSFSTIAECFQLRYSLNNLSQLSECNFLEITPDLNQSHGFVSRWHGLFGHSEDFSDLILESEKFISIDLRNKDFLEQLVLNLTAEDVLVGYSLGGRIALDLCFRAKQLPRKIILLGTNLGLKDSEREERRSWEDEIILKSQQLNHDSFVQYWNQLPVFRNEASKIFFNEKEREDNLQLFNFYRLSSQRDYSLDIQKEQARFVFVLGKDDEKFMSLYESRWANLNVRTYTLPGGHRVIHQKDKLKEIFVLEGIL